MSISSYSELKTAVENWLDHTLYTSRVPEFIAIFEAGANRRLPEADERLHLVRMPWRDALAAVERGEIADAKSIIGLFWLARLRE